MKEKRRKKGGGRKFMDGRMTKRQFKKQIRTYFYYDANISIKGFLLSVRMSRQTYYRFLNNNPDIKLEIDKFIVKNHLLRRPCINILDNDFELKPIEIQVMDLEI